MRYLSRIIAIVICFAISGCDVYDQFRDEMYMNVFCLIGDSENIYATTHSFKNEVSEGFVSIYCGGTNSIENDVTIVLEYDSVSIQEYNELNYDLDTARYTQWLHPSKYEIQTFSATMKAGQEDPYVVIPLKIFTKGITPDSIFFIPLKIKSITEGYTVNPDMSKVLYRPFVENDYAQTKVQTLYGLRGNSNGTEITATKIAFPISANQIRISVGKQTVLDGNSRIDLDLINKYSIVLTVNENNTVSVGPYATIQVEQLGEPGENRMEITDLTRFYIHYRYRTLEQPATETSEAVYSSWIEVDETLRRQN
jgi:hypothetical protein